MFNKSNNAQLLSMTIIGVHILLEFELLAYVVFKFGLKHQALLVE